MEAIHIVGAGGIGCAVGYALRVAQIPVVFVETNHFKVTFGQQQGVGVAGRAPLPATFVSFADWQPPDDAIVLLCTKCYDNADVLKKLQPATQLLPIQNGFDPELEQRDHEVEGISSFVSECEPDRPMTRITRRGDLHLGGRGGASPARLWLSPMAALLRQAKLFRVVEVQDVRPIKYTKLMYNAAISPLAAAAGIDNGDLLRIPLARKLFFELLRENYSILRHANKPLGKVGPFHPDTVMKILRREWLSRGLAFAFYPGLRGTYCSMSGDLPKGRTEIANYNERLVQWAGDFPCPINRRVVKLVRQMERDKTLPQVAMLNQFVG